MVIDIEKSTTTNDFWRYTVGDKIMVVINGVGGVGKDTFVKCVKQLLGMIEDPSPFSVTYRSICQNISTIDPVKQAAYKLGWTYIKDDKSRKFLSDLKALSTQFNDYPHKYVDKWWEEGAFKILFVHCREPEEIDRLVKDYDAKTLLIRRPDVDTPNNESDMAVENYEYDYIINNSGTYEELLDKAADFIKWLGCEEWIMDVNENDSSEWI